jgi:hypothetical protein
VTRKAAPDWSSLAGGSIRTFTTSTLGRKELLGERANEFTPTMAKPERRKSASLTYRGRLPDECASDPRQRSGSPALR